MNNREGDLQQWYRELPVITRMLMTTTFLSGLFITFGMLDPRLIYVDWTKIKENFQIWRLVTNFFLAGKFSINFAMHLYVLYDFSLRYERNPYNTGAGGTSSDYLYMVILAMGVLMSLDYFMPSGYHSESLLYTIMYVWSRRDPETIVKFFVFNFKAVYVCWVYCAMRMLMGGDIFMILMGIFTGHLYFFLVDVQGAAGSYIRTPGWVVRCVEWMTGRTQRAVPVAAPSSFSSSATSGAAPRLPPQNTYNWGSGQRLGR